jgi:hypothetical protein
MLMTVFLGSLHIDEYSESAAYRSYDRLAWNDLCQARATPSLVLVFVIVANPEFSKFSNPEVSQFFSKKINQVTPPQLGVLTTIGVANSRFL